MKIRPVGAELCCTRTDIDRQKDRHTWRS